MKKAGWLFFFSISILLQNKTFAQEATYVAPSNISYAGLEKDMLLYATNRYTVTQSGIAPLLLPALFDGQYFPSYSTVAPTEDNPTVITVSGLPNINTQADAKIGWTTRYWPPTKFKIEGFDNAGNTWITLANVSGNSSTNYSYDITGLVSKFFTSFRFTFYAGSGTDGRFGISELFFLQNETAQAYDGLMVKYNPNGNVLIGKTSQTNTDYKLDINGKIRANELVVNTTGADFVFDSGYHLDSLGTVSAYIKEHHHLKGVPSATEMQQKGIKVGLSEILLLQKVEELTLYILKQDKELASQEKRIKALENKEE